jgi:hypothetical protein
VRNISRQVLNALDYLHACATICFLISLHSLRCTLVQLRLSSSGSLRGMFIHCSHYDWLHLR